MRVKKDFQGLCLMLLLVFFASKISAEQVLMQSSSGMYYIVKSAPVTPKEVAKIESGLVISPEDAAKAVAQPGKVIVVNTKEVGKKWVSLTRYEVTSKPTLSIFYENGMVKKVHNEEIMVSKKETLFFVLMIIPCLLFWGIVFLLKMIRSDVIDTNAFIIKIIFSGTLLILTLVVTPSILVILLRDDIIWGPFVIFFTLLSLTGIGFLVFGTVGILKYRINIQSFKKAVFLQNILAVVVIVCAYNFW